MVLSAGVVALSIVSFSSFVGHAQAQPAQQGRAQQAAPAPAPPPQAGDPSGKLVIWGDTAIFINPTDPNNCILTNRFKRGERVGFRMTAIDGGTGEIEQTAALVAHVTFAGKTVDVPMNWRGAAGPTAPTPRGYIRTPYELWTGSWTVPMDAPVGRISYTVTATDKFGRKADFRPFSAEASQLVIVQ